MVVDITDKRRWAEIAAVLATGAGKFVFMDHLQLRLPFIGFAVLAWAAYILTRTRYRKGILYYWGFRSDNFRSVFYRVLPFGLVAIAACLLTGFLRGTLNPSWHLFPVLAVYPVWGVIQQFLVVGLVAGNLHDMQGLRLKQPVIIFLTAALFGAIHYPYYWLVLGTFVLALFYGYVYLQSKNLYVLGIFHGWLGALFFYTVVNRDPFLEVFGPYLNEAG